MAEEQKPAIKNNTGRPSVYTDELADTILSRMASGESVAEICRDPNMPARSTVMLWVAQDRCGFSDKYAKMMQVRAFTWADELLDIADDGSNDWMEKNDEGNEAYRLNGEHVQRSKLRVDSRKWLLSKLLPQYNDKYFVDQTVKGEHKHTHEVKAVDKFADVLKEFKSE